MSFVDGTMSREEFDDGAREFANDGLAQRRIAMDASSARYVELEADETQAVVEYLDDDDDDPQVRRRQIRGLSVRFHITYNASFRVPVLAVNVRRLPDTQLTPEQVLALLHPNRARNRVSDPVISPYVNPSEFNDGNWACVHPCTTAEIMKLLLASDTSETISPKRYLEIWLRYVAREANLEVTHCGQLRLPKPIDAHRGDIKS